jgi:hypothetical protein
MNMQYATERIVVTTVPPMKPAMLLLGLTFQNASVVFSERHTEDVGEGVVPEYKKEVEQEKERTVVGVPFPVHLADLDQEGEEKTWIKQQKGG